MAVNLTRAVGQTMARLADWEVATLVHRVEELETGTEATGSRTGSAMRLIQQVNDPFERLWSTPGAATWPPRSPGSRRWAPTRRTCTPPR